MKRITRTLGVAIASMLLAGAALAEHNTDHHKSSMFAGPKANTGMVSHLKENGKSMLRVSQDFKVPRHASAHLARRRLQGRHTLDAFKIKGGEKREVTVPAYVRDTAKVEVYCAWAEVLLGESSFSSPVK